MSTALIELRQISKTFPGVIANDQVDLQLQPGEIKALLGENGAGKSTLVKMIYGILKPDGGSILYEGKQVSIDSPAQARSLGIAMVFQHFSLFDSLTVVENIALGIDQKLDLAELSERITELSERYGLPLDPARHVYTLSVGERQRIEIIRCLLQEPRLLIMDEPTSVLTPQEVEKLFVTLKRLSDEGVAILYISHKLDEIKALCHQATILRLGKKVASVNVDEETTASLAAMMMGEALPDFDRSENGERGQVMMDVRDLHLPSSEGLGISLREIYLRLHAGEVVGIAGVAGNGQDELLQALNGERCVTRPQSILIKDEPCGQMGANARRRKGMASVPEKRLGHGAVPDMSLIDNGFMTAWKRMKLLINGLINYSKTSEFTWQVIKTFKVKTPTADAPADSLSGGNLQKFIVGRELLQLPSVLVVAQPTWGVDAGAAQTIRRALRQRAAEGAAVLVISQDLDELMEITDRIGAICGGRLSAFYDTATVTVEQVGQLMAGVKLQQEVPGAV